MSWSLALASACRQPSGRVFLLQHSAGERSLQQRVSHDLRHVPAAGSCLGPGTCPRMSLAAGNLVLRVAAPTAISRPRSSPPSGRNCWCPPWGAALEGALGSVPLGTAPIFALLPFTPLLLPPLVCVPCFTPHHAQPSVEAAHFFLCASTNSQVLQPLLGDTWAAWCRSDWVHGGFGGFLAAKP